MVSDFTVDMNAVVLLYVKQCIEEWATIRIMFLLLTILIHRGSHNYNLYNVYRDRVSYYSRHYMYTCYV